MLFRSRQRVAGDNNIKIILDAERLQQDIGEACSLVGNAPDAVVVLLQIIQAVHHTVVATAEHTGILFINFEKDRHGLYE